MSSIAKGPDGRFRARCRDEHGRKQARHFDRKLDAARSRGPSAGLTRERTPVTCGNSLDQTSKRIRPVGSLTNVWSRTSLTRSSPEGHDVRDPPGSSHQLIRPTRQQLWVLVWRI